MVRLGSCADLGAAGEDAGDAATPASDASGSTATEIRDHENVDDGGTRCASITGGMVALELAVKGLLSRGLIERTPLTGSVAAVSSGIGACTASGVAGGGVTGFVGGGSGATVTVEAPACGTTGGALGARVAAIGGAVAT